jgi:EpsI family protein
MKSKRRLAMLGVAAIAFAMCFAYPIASLVGVWSANPLYSYGFAVPFIAAYIWWSRAQQAPVTPAPPDYRAGVPFVIGGVILLSAGWICAMNSIEDVSVVVTFVGLLLMLFGRDAVKPHWFALAYLLLMVPIWSIPIAALQDPSRLLSTKIATGLLRLVGIPALRDGTNILLASHTIVVLRECSGVNQLIALTAMVLPASYLWLDSNVRRAMLLCSAVVISYIGNGIRIATVGWLAYNGFGDGMLEGNAHLMQGLVVSAIGYLGVGILFSILSRSNAPVVGELAETVTRPAGAVGATVRRNVWLDAAIVSLMLAAAAARVSAKPLEVQLPNDLARLESRIGDWTLEFGQTASGPGFPGIDDDLVVGVGRYPSETGERRFAGADTELVRAYRTASGARVQLYVGYYQQQREGKELAGDASEVLADAASPLAVTTESGTITLKEIVRENAGRRRGLLFWYDVNGRITSDIYRAKAYSILDAVTRRSTNGAVVMVAWDAAPGADAKLPRLEAIAFVRALVPALRRHLPE